jgi:hypothetical protein
MAVSPAQRPDDNSTTPGSLVAGTDVDHAWSGTPAHDGDATNMLGQYPPGDWGTSIFGGTLPTGTGAPGTPGAVPSQAGTDPTNEPGQTEDGFTGISEEEITSTGAPGADTPASHVTPEGVGGPDHVTFTEPGSFLSGSYQAEDLTTSLSGPADSTQANAEGYATGGPKLPGMFEPEAGTGKFQPKSGGRVLRGGRAVSP